MAGARLTAQASQDEATSGTPIGAEEPDKAGRRKACNECKQQKVNPQPRTFSPPQTMWLMPMSS